MPGGDEVGGAAAASRNWVLLSKDRSKSLALRITGVDALPADDDGVCSITLERIDQSTLDFAPEGTTFFEGEPSLCVATLPCRHRFHAVAVLFHMAVSSMNCPLCRSVYVCLSFFPDPPRPTLSRYILYFFKKKYFFSAKFCIHYRYPAKGGICTKRHFFDGRGWEEQGLGRADRGHRCTKTRFQASGSSDMAFPRVAFFRGFAKGARPDRCTKTRLQASIRTHRAFPAFSIFAQIKVYPSPLRGVPSENGKIL